jgi:hypothetical protein
VKLHRNAKTTPRMRTLVVDRVRRLHWTPGAVAAAAGISVRTAYKWWARHRKAGVAGLVDGSSAPRRQPHRTAGPVIAAIVAARHERLPAWAIARRLQLPPVHGFRQPRAGRVGAWSAAGMNTFTSRSMPTAAPPMSRCYPRDRPRGGRLPPAHAPVVRAPRPA